MFKLKNGYIHFINIGENNYLQLKVLKNKKIIRKYVTVIFFITVNFNNIPYYVTSEVSLKRFQFALFDDGLTLKL